MSIRRKGCLQATPHPKYPRCAESRRAFKSFIKKDLPGGQMCWSVPCFNVGPLFLPNARSCREHNGSHLGPREKVLGDSQLFLPT